MKLLTQQELFVKCQVSYVSQIHVDHVASFKMQRGCQLASLASDDHFAVFAAAGDSPSVLVLYCAMAEVSCLGPATQMR